MKINKLLNLPVEGKTYSLFGNSGSTHGYYDTIRNLTARILENNPDISYVIETLHKFSSQKRYLRKLLKKPVQGNLVSEWLNFINTDLKLYTQKTEEHLKNLPPFKFWDRRLRTTREQYHLYMLEIELTNRLFAGDFKQSDKKIALLPYCLQDFTVNCKSVKNEFDYQCKHCSSRCFQNYTSAVLEKNNIDPYIWRGADLKQLAISTFKSHQSLGVLGIACIPELVWGMRKCRKYKIPVVGIPLNANRCIRWFGEFFPNSIDLIELEKLIEG